MKIVRTLIWFTYFWLYLIVKLPGLYKANKLKREGRTEELDAYTGKVVGQWARSLLKVAGAKVTVKGQENLHDGAAVYVANHQGNFDVPIMLGYIGTPKPLLAKIEIAKLPFIRDWMKFLRCIFIDRNNVRQAMNSLKQATEQVEQGYSIVVFPEGTRSKGEQFGEFKNGAFRIAVKAGVPIVPIRISGSYKLMEANGNLIAPADVFVTILPSVPTEGLTKEEITALPERVQAIIEQA